MLVSDSTSTGKPWLELNLTNTDRDIGRERGSEYYSKLGHGSSNILDPSYRPPSDERLTLSSTGNIELSAVGQGLKKTGVSLWDFPFYIRQ